MPDLYFTEDGDIALSTSGDIAITQSESRNISQQIYIRVMTDLGDFTTYPNLGSRLNNLMGMPQSPETGQAGVALIKDALKRDGLFEGRELTVKAIPTGNQTIRFDIYTFIDNQNSLVLSVEQDLGVV